MGTLFPSYLAVLREIEAEMDTKRIAASRSFRIYRSEGSHPSKKLVFEGFCLRSTEVDRSRDSIRGFLGRPDGFGSLDFAQVVDLFMLYRSTLVSGADSIKHMDCLAEEGSKFDNCFWLK